MMSDMKDYRPLTLKQALQLAAPHTWAASLCPALFGPVYCRLTHIPLPLWKAVLLTAACVLLQSAVNALNDYHDFVKGTDSMDDNVEENDAVLVYGNVDPRSARNLGMLFLVIGAVLGLICSIRAGWLPVLIGMTGALCIFLYSGGPLPLSYLPVGELVSGTVMGGLIPLGTAACTDGKLHADIVLFSIPLILGIGLIMMSNNGCDIEKDMAAGRKTLPVCLGRKGTLYLYRLVMVCWVILVIVFTCLLTGKTGLVTVLLLLAAVGHAIVGQLKLGLKSEERIRQMKGIIRCNLLINGTYIVSLVFGLIRGIIHG